MIFSDNALNVFDVMKKVCRGSDFDVKWFNQTGHLSPGREGIRHRLEMALSLFNRVLDEFPPQLLDLEYDTLCVAKRA